jgi:hypothetical protein
MSQRIAGQKRGRPEVLPAFSAESRSALVASTRETEAEAANKYPFVYPEIRAELTSFLLSNPNKQRDILQDDRNRLNKVLSRFGLETQSYSLIKIKYHERAFRNIIKNKPNTDIRYANPRLQATIQSGGSRILSPSPIKKYLTNKNQDLIHTDVLSTT